MHFDFTFNGILFTLTIFGLLLTKIMQLIRAYVIPFLLTQIRQEKADRTELMEKENFITSTQHKVENQIRIQKKLFEDLEKNVQKWHSFLYAKKELFEEEMLSTKMYIEKKRIIQRKNHAFKTMYSLTIPEAIKMATVEIGQKCQKSEGDQLFNELIEKLNKENHVNVY